MHHPTDMITHTTAFVTTVVEHWLKREIAQCVHHKGSIRRPIAPWANDLTTELHLAPYSTGDRNGLTVEILSNVCQFQLRTIVCMDFDCCWFLFFSKLIGSGFAFPTRLNIYSHSKTKLKKEKINIFNKTLITFYLYKYNKYNNNNKIIVIIKKKIIIIKKKKK